MSNETSPVAPGAAPCLSDGRYTDFLTRRNSVARLSQRFKQHNFRTRASSPWLYGTSPLRAPEHSLQSGTTIPNIHPNDVHQGRNTLSCDECTSAHLTKISALAEDMMSGENQHHRAHSHSSIVVQSSSYSSGQLSSYNIIPSKPLHDSTVYFVVAPPSLSPASTTADDSGYDSADDAPPNTSASRIDRRIRRKVSTRDTSVASDTCVIKPIRMRKRGGGT